MEELWATHSGPFYSSSTTTVAPRGRGGTSAGERLFQQTPDTTGDVRVDAALAGLAEHLARQDGWQPQEWVLDDGRYAQPWWFVSGVRAWHPIALVESPLSFRKRGVFITRSALERV